MKSQRAFTLIEVILVIAILAVLAAAVFLAINPVKRINDSQDSRRREDLIAWQKAIQLYTAEHNGSLPSEFSLSSLGTSDKVVVCGTANTATCLGQNANCVVSTSLVPTYLATLPKDPIEGHDVDSGYYVTRTGTNGLTFGSCHASNAAVVLQTATNLSIPAYVPPCSGYDSQGYCWYLAADNTQDCNTVCASHGGCNAATTWNDTAACVVGKHFAPACDCYASQAFGGEHTVSPKIYSTSNCYYRASGSAYCNNPASLPSGHKRLCACNS
jgi:prepilin-type N-terminal cleavage/methylation domain-containing protein